MFVRPATVDRLIMFSTELLRLGNAPQYQNTGIYAHYGKLVRRRPPTERRGHLETRLQSTLRPVFIIWVNYEIGEWLINSSDEWDLFRDGIDQMQVANYFDWRPQKKLLNKAVSPARVIRQCEIDMQYWSRSRVWKRRDSVVTRPEQSLSFAQISLDTCSLNFAARFSQQAFAEPRSNLCRQSSWFNSSNSHQVAVQKMNRLTFSTN